MPLDRWFRKDLGSYVRGMLCSGDSRVRDCLSAPASNAMVSEHQAGAADHGDPIWSLLRLEIFLRREGW